MPVLRINISIDIDVNYYQKETSMTDEEIIKKVYEEVKQERNNLAMEARISALSLLNGDGI